ncbi:uncharacterized protein YecT (DUF1311 family) [Crenobacter luteus]|uniref:lysozyme inhibitor LprI family protein n=1 Tax=Crenobacter luteus TaxID=1452487 RepID=UPI0010E51156|nr:lysozyme inhibitor LprI family protein [Crenobacter luteus]TCP11261.1 uncharacterized protein YecT (DUF1311 family) [Crenobacter luteus]
MKTAIAAVLLAGLGLAGHAAAGPSYGKPFHACMERAGGVTQAMIECIGEELDRQDARLNRVYRERLSELVPARRALLQSVQRQWLRYRDANCGFYYDPDGGSIARVLAADCRLRMTAERADELDALGQR